MKNINKQKGEATTMTYLQKQYLMNRQGRSPESKRSTATKNHRKNRNFEWKKSKASNTIEMAEKRSREENGKFECKEMKRVI